MFDSSLRPRAFIGTRDLSRIPLDVVDLFVELVEATAEHGIPIHTGAAPGADQAATSIALTQGGRVKLFLPWRGFEAEWCARIQADYSERVEVEAYDPALHSAWRQSVWEYHPNPQALTYAAMSLHARNFGIVHQCGEVVALPRATDQGGSAQGIRIARALHIPVYDLSTEEGRERLTALLKENPR